MDDVARGWGDDEALLAELGLALRHAGTAPDTVEVDGKAAWAWRGIDAELELASLVLDSSVDEAAAVRGAGPRLLVFDGGTVSLEVEVGDDALLGQLLPPVTGEVALVAADGSETTVRTDEVGCFALPLPSGPARLRARTPQGDLLTDWLAL